MVTFQDFLQDRATGDEEKALMRAINEWRSGEIFKTAIIADEYDHRRNTTVCNYIQKIFSLTGTQVENFTASNNKVASNFFARLNTQRNTYSLGHGVFFSKSEIKDRFGEEFDEVLLDAGYYALIHGVSFPVWTGKLSVFKATEFVPLYDEETGALSAGIRFWQLASDKPMSMVVYEQDGYTKWKRDNKGMELVAPKRAYELIVRKTLADGEEIVGANNYSKLPVFALWGDKRKQSTLIGMREQIDTYDLIRSGFANDLTDVAQIYWIIENYGGMTDAELAKFRDRMLINHIVEADTSQGGKITPYTQEVPHQARETFLSGIRSDIYESFGALDVHSVSANSTNDHLDAAYQPMDENADDFEMQIIGFVQALGEMLGLNRQDCIPLFKRNRIVNQKEVCEMILSAAEYLDEETILKKLPFLTVDEVKDIIKRKEKEDLDRGGLKQIPNPPTVEEQEEEEEENE